MLENTTFPGNPGVEERWRLLKPFPYYPGSVSFFISPMDCITPAMFLPLRQKLGLLSDCMF
jgi:hypothetical protein